MACRFAASLALSLLVGVAATSVNTDARHGGDLAPGGHAAATGRARLLQASSKKAAKSFVKSLDFKRRLRVCNTYPYSAAIDVFHGKEKITRTPLLYKTCREFTPLMRAGDKIQFNIGGSNAGAFEVSDLPNNDAILVLVIYRHDTDSTAVAFESHVFANLINAQVAVLDTYQGKAKASPRIQDTRAAKTSRNEELRYDSVVAVNPGIYEVVLQDDMGALQARERFVALSRESYVVIRAGVESESGPLYPQVLVVYPQSDPSALLGAASSARWSWGLVSILSAVALLAASPAP